jgi:hypothetical protein
MPLRTIIAAYCETHVTRLSEHRGRKCCICERYNTWYVECILKRKGVTRLYPKGGHLNYNTRFITNVLFEQKNTKLWNEGIFWKIIQKLCNTSWPWSKFPFCFHDFVGTFSYVSWLLVTQEFRSLGYIRKRWACSYGSWIKSKETALILTILNPRIRAGHSPSTTNHKLFLKAQCWKIRNWLFASL